MQVSITLSGTTPLMLNRFTDEAAERATNGSSSAASAAGRRTPQETAQSALYIGLDGLPMVPQPNLLRCLVDGGRFHKAGKVQITTAKSSLLYACVDIEGAEIPIQHKQPWKVDTRAVRIPATGGRILAHRPMFDDWALSFVATIDTDILNPKLFRQIVDDAGKRIGLGAFRPAVKGPYGRFVVTKWEETEPA